MVEVDDLVRGLGGVVDRQQLLRFVTRRRLDVATASGLLIPAGRGRYATRDVDDSRCAALRVGGVLCLTSAAQHHGWSVAFSPRQPHVMVPRNRSVSTAAQRGLQLHRWDGAHDGTATSPEQTVLDCATHFPLLEAVCVGDSAIRHRDCTRSGLLRAAEASPRSGRAKRVAVVELLDGRSFNAFESAVRVLGREAGLELVPQLYLPGYGHPDLRDPVRRGLVECDSVAFHTSRVQLVHDVERYNQAALLGHQVLRFAWEHPFGRPDYVIRTLSSWAEAYDLAHQVAPAARADTVRCPRPCCALAN